jgi:hypothetical protein
VALNPDHYAIVIGIDSYPFLRRLQASGKDATRFQNWLLAEDGGGLLPEHIATIISPATLPSDGTDAKPVQDEIDKALIRFGVVRGGRVGARLYFYFAGHAFGPNFDDVGILMANAADWLLGSNVGLRPYRNFFHERAPFDEVVYILDCCRDRVGQIGTQAPKFTLPPVNGEVNPVHDFVVLAAAYGEKAFQADDPKTGERRGLLTQAMLDGLQGAARDAEGRVTASMLRDYVRRRVPVLAKERGEEEKLRQRPQVQWLAEKEMIFGPIVPVVATNQVRVRIIAPARLKGELVVLNGMGLDEVARRPAASATEDKDPWLLDLAPNSFYLVQLAGSTHEEILDTRKAKEQPYVFRFPRPR